MDQIMSFADSATAWVLALAETTLRTSLILLVSGAIALGLRGGPAALRHLVWAVALAGVLLAPLGATYLPAIGLPFPSLSPALTNAVAVARSPLGVIRGTAQTGAQSPLAADAVTRQHVPLRRFDATLDQAEPEVAPAARSVGGTAPASARVTTPQIWSLTIFGLWFVGATALLLRMGAGLLATHRLGQTAEPPRDDEWRTLAIIAAEELGLVRPVRVLSSPRAAMPMTWGWRRPVVVVPSAGDWPTGRKRVVLFHELSHVKRYDCAWQWVANVALSVHWFNPLVWLAARAQRLERERACDEAVVQSGTPASAYADHLLEIARTHCEPRWSAIGAVAMARRSQLERRLLSILAPGRRARTSHRRLVALAVTMTLIIASLAAVTPSARGPVTASAASQPVRPPAAPSAMRPTRQVFQAPQARQTPPAPRTPKPTTPAALERTPRDAGFTRGAGTI